jgi:hypothetical protein
MFQAFFVKSSVLKVFTCIYLIPFLFGCITLRFEPDFGIYIWIIPSLTGSIAWLTTVGLFLHHRTSIELQLSKINYITSIIIAPIILIVLLYGSLDTSSGFFVFFYSVSHIYILYFFSKSLTMVELKKSTGLLTYLGTMIFLAMPPIGLFLIQPRIQKIANSQQ